MLQDPKSCPQKFHAILKSDFTEAMEAFIAQAQTLATTADENGRKKILDTLRDAQYSLETPFDTLQRLAGLHLQIAGARLGVDLAVFDALSRNKNPLSVVELAEQSGAAPELMGRILRYLASIGMLKETGKDEFTANNITKVLADPNYQGGVHHFFDTVGPVFQELPDYLAETKYKNITDNGKTVIQKAFNIDIPGFIWFPSQPKRFAYFQQVMTVQRAGALDWLSVFPVQKEVGTWSAEPNKAVFVDVGGGFGHQCLAFKSKYPNLDGRVILQDIPQTLEHVPPMEGVEVMVQNFFEPQAIKGAKFYYLRNILHDWPDDKCVAILKSLIPYMDKDSRILIDDMVLPNTGVHWQAAQLDLTMMAALGSVERTKEQWYALMESAGLKILHIYTYTTSLQDSVIVAVAK